jgi:hypothetical protein
MFYTHLSRLNVLDLPPALRGTEHWLAQELSNNARKWGRYAALRWAARRGFPIELALASVYA